MKHSIYKSNKLPADNELLSHMPKALQTMAIIEQRAQAIFSDIKASIERGETTLAEVKQKRGIGFSISQEEK